MIGVAVQDHDRTQFTHRHLKHVEIAGRSYACDSSPPTSSEPGLSPASLGSRRLTLCGAVSSRSPPARLTDGAVGDENHSGGNC